MNVLWCLASIAASTQLGVFTVYLAIFNLSTVQDAKVIVSFSLLDFCKALIVSLYYYWLNKQICLLISNQIKRIYHNLSLSLIVPNVSHNYTATCHSVYMKCCKRMDTSTLMEKSTLWSKKIKFLLRQLLRKVNKNCRCRLLVSFFTAFRLLNSLLHTPHRGSKIQRRQQHTVSIPFNNMPIESTWC